jgi:hypothetical protein
MILKLQQDNHEKIKIEIEENFLIYHLKNYFKWKKNVSLNRLMKEGSLKYD